MKQLVLAFLLTVPYLYSQTNNVTLTEKPSIVLNFIKNDSGEIVVKVNGHSQPLEIQFNGAKTGTLYLEDSSVNLSHLGFESAFLALDTASGSGGSKVDSQAVIPPVNPSVSPNPPLSTPF